MCYLDVSRLLRWGTADVFQWYVILFTHTLSLAVSTFEIHRLPMLVISHSTQTQPPRVGTLDGTANWERTAMKI